MKIIISEYSLNIAASQGMDCVKDKLGSHSQKLKREDKHGATFPSPALLSLHNWPFIKGSESLWEIKLKETPC